MATRTHVPFEVIACVANGIARHRHELCKQLQVLHVDVALFWETHLEPYERGSISSYYFYRTDKHPGRKGGIVVAVRKGIPHNHVDLPPRFSRSNMGLHTYW
jgi:hypothetical protein